MVTSERSVKRIICKTWIRTFANSVDPDQTPQNAASDQGQHCLLKLQEVKVNETFLRPHSGLFSQPTLRDNRPTSAVIALIFFLSNG